MLIREVEYKRIDSKRERDLAPSARNRPRGARTCTKPATYPSSTRPRAAELPWGIITPQRTPPHYPFAHFLLDAQGFTRGNTNLLLL